MSISQYIHFAARVVLSATVAVTFAGCITDHPAEWYDMEQPVTIALRAATREAGRGNGAATRGVITGDQRDNRIGTLRVMGFREADGTLAFNSPVEITGIDRHDFEGVNALTGRYTLVVVANEHEDPVLAAALAELDCDTGDGVAARIGDLSDMAFRHEAFAGDKNIPMVKRLDNVSIDRTGAVHVPGQSATAPGSPLSIEMERLGVRLDITLSLYTPQFEAWWGTSDPARTVHFEDVPDRVYLFPRDNTEFTLRRSVRYEGAEPAEDDGKKSVEVARVILPEIYFTPEAGGDKGLRIRVESGDNIWNGTVVVGAVPDTRCYTVPRNSRLDVAVTSGRDAAKFEAVAVADWGDEAIDAPTDGAHHDVVVEAAEGGTARADRPHARAGETVTVVAVPEPGMALGGWTFLPAVAMAEGTGADSPAAKFIMPAGGVKVTPDFYCKNPVGDARIGNTIWAKTNAAAFGGFAAEEHGEGNFFQWGYSDPLPPATVAKETGAAKPMVTAERWSRASDPCPTGWHVPARAEVDALTNTEGVSMSWDEVSGVLGCRFTDEGTGETMFLPSAGYRTGSGEPQSHNNYGYYWTSTTEPCVLPTDLPERAYFIQFYTYGIDNVYNEYRETSWGVIDKRVALPVRCVREAY